MNIETMKEALQAMNSAHCLLTCAVEGWGEDARMPRRMKQIRELLRKAEQLIESGDDDERDQ